MPGCPSSHGTIDFHNWFQAKFNIHGVRGHDVASATISSCKNMLLRIGGL